MKNIETNAIADWLKTRRKLSLATAATVATILVASACSPLPVVDPEPEPGNTPVDKDPTPAPTPPPSNIAINKNSVVIHSPDGLSQAFSFEKTINQIIQTSGGSAISATDFLNSMINSFGQSSFSHPQAGINVPVSRRLNESRLVAADLLNPASANGMIPVGIFNRFDLAPADGSNCGEHRIVYAKRSGNALDRFTIIFEARVPNPNPGQGIGGCKPITDFWAERSNDPNLFTSIAELERFYYRGVRNIPPVVDARNYGLPLGQIRSNLFMVTNSNNQWSLREHLVSFNANGQPILKAEPVDDSPISAYFRSSVLPPGIPEGERFAFGRSFVGFPVCNLVNPDLLGNSGTSAIVNGIGAGFSSQFNDFESISQGSEDDPSAFAATTITSGLNDRLSSLNLNQAISSQQLLNRAGAMTCGGCHQFSNGKTLGNGANWPASLGFVHIDENGSLSPLLVNEFIPKRMEIAQTFLNNPAPFQAEEGRCPTPRSATEAVARSAPRTQPDSNEYRGADIYKQVDNILNGMLTQSRSESAQAATDMSTTINTLNDAIKRSRSSEKGSSGAFNRVRRTH